MRSQGTWDIPCRTRLPSLNLRVGRRPPTRSAVPAWLTSALAWPEFAALRGAAGGTNMSKLRRLAGFLITSARVALAAALIEDDSWPTAGLHGRNHPSWENNPEVQVALGPTLANWLYSGKLEYVAPGHRVPIIIEPVGAVPKSSHPLFHLITDARLGNYIYAAWGSVYHSIDDAALSLEPFDFFYCVDPVDAYHTVAFAGCAQGIVIEKMIWIDQHGQLHVREQRFLGCSPCTCTGACEESLSGICLG